jgi:hypothetical protein
MSAFDKEKAFMHARVQSVRAPGEDVGKPVAALERPASAHGNERSPRKRVRWLRASYFSVAACCSGVSIVFSSGFQIKRHCVVGVRRGSGSLARNATGKAGQVPFHLWRTPCLARNSESSNRVRLVFLVAVSGIFCGRHRNHILGGFSGNTANHFCASSFVARLACKAK